MKSKFRMYVIVGICIMLVGMIVFLSSYALWRVKETQTGENVVNGACLGFTLVEEESDNNLITGFTLEDAWPISDEEGKSLKGYTFKLENTCDKAIDYEIVLESLKTESANYFDNEYIKVQLDNGRIKRLSELEIVDDDGAALYANDIRESKHLYSGTIQKHVEDSEYNIKTHTIRIWISEDSPNSEIGKEFKSKIKVYAGQLQIPPEHKLSDESCFTFNSNTKTITNYDVEKCGTELVLPPTIDGIPVEIIATDYNFPSQSLTYVNLENAKYLKYIGNHTFLNYIGTEKELIIPDSVTTIGADSFNSYRGTKLILGNNVETIGFSSFYSYGGLELIIPDSVTSIGNSAFHAFDGSKLVLGSKIETIGSSTFSSYEGTGKELIIPDSVRSIGSDAFSRFNGTNLILGNNVTSIGASAFLSYKGSEMGLIIPDSVITIGSMAFWTYGRFGGLSLTLGRNVNSIGSEAFKEYTGNINAYNQTICDSVSNWAPNSLGC